MKRWIDEQIEGETHREKETKRKSWHFSPPTDVLSLKLPPPPFARYYWCLPGEAWKSWKLVLVFGVPPRPTRWVWTSCWRPFTADVAEVLWIDGWMAGYIIDYILYIYVHASLICHIHYSGDFWRNSSNIHQYIFVVHAFTQFHCSLYTSETWALTCCKHSPLLS